jgi:hypothetical protein
MAQPILSSDQLFLDQGIGHVLRQGEQAGTITDAMVAASTTNAALQALVTAGTGATDVLPYKQLVNRALTLGLADGSMSDSNVNAATTVTLLVANTYSQAGKIGPISEFI